MVFFEKFGGSQESMEKKIKPGIWRPSFAGSQDFHFTLTTGVSQLLLLVFFLQELLAVRVFKKDLFIFFSSLTNGSLHLGRSETGGNCDLTDFSITLFFPLFSQIYSEQLS